MAITHRRRTVTAGCSLILQVRILFVTLAITLTTRGQAYSIASCNSTIPGSEIPLCHCDAGCRIYHDCCYGHNYNDTILSQDAMSKIEDMKGSSTCERLPGQPYHFYMVTPSTEVSVRYQKFVMSCRKPTSAKTLIPVYDPVIRRHFRNEYCHGLYKMSKHNNDINVSLLWTLELNSDCYTHINVTSYALLLHQILVNKVCTFNLVPPHGSRPRLCFKHNLKNCSMKAKCASYQSPIVNNIDEVFRNRYCAACTNPREQYTDLAVKEGQHDEETILTLTPLHEMITPFDNCSSPVKRCRDYCGDEISVGFGHFGKCIKPVSKARGLLHSLEVNIGGRLYKDPDGQKTRATLSRYVNMTEDMYVKGTMKYTINPCLNFVHVSIYTTVNIDYETFIQIASILKDAITVYTNNVEEDIMNSTIPVNKHCVFVNPNAKGGSEAKVSPFNAVQLIIFFSVSCGIVMLFICIVLLNSLIKRLRMAPETNNE